MTTEDGGDARAVLGRPSVAPLLAASAALAPGLGDAWIVGGAVRDAVLGRPDVDVDLTILGDAHAYADALAAALGGSATERTTFGTATVEAPGARSVHLATARRERYPGPGALPLVEPAASLDEDLGRRDFTVNAVAVGLSSAVRGRVVDPFGGLAAIAAAELTALHPRSFVDDPTRILRGLRYAVRLGFFFDDPTAAAIDEAVAGRALATVSGARILRELRIAADEPTFVEFVATLEPFGVAAALAPSWRPSGGELVLGAAEGMLHRLAAVEVDRPLVRLAALWLGATSAAAAVLAERLPFSATELATFGAAERAVAAADAVGTAAWPSSVARALDPLPVPVVVLVGALCELHRAAGEADGESVARIVHYLEADRGRGPELDGREVMRLTGLPPSPRVGRILADLRAAVLDGEVAGRAQEERFVLGLAARGGDEAGGGGREEDRDAGDERQGA